ncbi:alanine racemase [Micromonospora sp. DT233]|uniref:alanine racemase n=1 Tax=Micromonospora sp. DT233 TaxID=3393432 RepID=UPI003CF1EC37
MTVAAPDAVDSPNEARIDLRALAHNVRTLQDRVGGAAVMAVVKADAYGHGMVPCAVAARAAGAQWLGAALPTEALELRAAGVPGRILTWLWTVNADLTPVVAADIDISVSARWALDVVVAAVRRAGRPARIHLKADTGLSRNGASSAEWGPLVDAALAAQAAGAVDVVGVWSHLACADEPRHPSVAAQLTAFRQAVSVAERAGARLEVRHLANSPATLLLPQSHFDLVRVGVALYGLSPATAHGSSADFDLRPVMSLAARLAAVRQVPAGTGVSYGHRHRTSTPTTLGLVPLGYADGIPRHASGRGQVLVGAHRRPVCGVVAMDQFVVDLGGSAAAPGDEVLVFGPGDRGEPTAQDWAEAAGTISYEIVTRIGARVPRTYAR